jgi:HK97 family phage prohead protease
MQHKFLTINNKSFQEFGATNTKELWEKAQEKGFTALSYEIPVQFKAVDKEENSFDVIFSTADEDRHGDIVEQNFDLKFFKKNPVFLDSHNYGSIEHIIGRINKVRVEENKLRGQVEFALMNPKGALAYEMAKAGFINTTSIGFIPEEFDKDGKILKSQLLEVSAVSVPANARALFEKIVEDYEGEIAEIKEKMVYEEPTVEEVIETKTILSKKTFILNAIRKSLEEMEANNLRIKKQQIFKALRSL